MGRAANRASNASQFLHIISIIVIRLCLPGRLAKESRRPAPVAEGRRTVGEVVRTNDAPGRAAVKAPLYFAQTHAVNP
jgi:hypothetical protein